MKKMKYIFLREFKSYFISPVAYIVAFIFLAIVGWFFFSVFFLNYQASMERFFAVLPTAFVFIIPAVTMKSFSEEINIGSYELLLTLPITFRDIIVGKFLAAFTFVVFILVPTLFYALSVSMLGSLDWGPVIGAYLGTLLVVAVFTSIGIFASAMTRNQIVSFILSMSICFFLTVIVDYIIFFVPLNFVDFVQYLSIGFHFNNIAKGIIDSRDIVYFISLIFIALYGTQILMRERK